jgi:hypothetical protein
MRFSSAMSLIASSASSWSKAVRCSSLMTKAGEASSAIPGAGALIVTVRSEEGH